MRANHCNRMVTTDRTHDILNFHLFFYFTFIFIACCHLIIHDCLRLPLVFTIINKVIIWVTINNSIGHQAGCQYEPCSILENAHIAVLLHDGNNNNDGYLYVLFLQRSHSHFIKNGVNIKLGKASE